MGADPKYLISLEEPLQAQYLGKPGQSPLRALPGPCQSVPDLADRLSGAACWYSATLRCRRLMQLAFYTNFVEKIVSKDID